MCVCLAFQGNEEVISLLVAANIKDSDAITAENGAKKRASQIARWKGFESAAASIERFFFFFFFLIQYLSHIPLSLQFFNASLWQPRDSECAHTDFSFSSLRIPVSSGMELHPSSVMMPGVSAAGTSVTAAFSSTSDATKESSKKRTRLWDRLKFL